MNLLNFVEQYPDDNICKAAFKAYRDKEGVVCPKCGSREHYWLQVKEAYQCKCCEDPDGFRSHTVMHGSHLSFRYWLIAIHLLTGVRANMKNRHMPLWDRIMPGKRYVIECISDMLKNTAQLVHSRHRSISSFLMNMVTAMGAYCFFENKPKALQGYQIEKTKQIELW